MKLQIIPYTLKKANVFITEHHRHSKRVQGARFCLAAVYNDEVVGILVVGRPVARKLDDGFTAEVTRSCVKDGAPKNTNSFMYGKAWRAWQQMGGRKMITYTLEKESGATMRAVNWKLLGTTRAFEKGKGWTTRPNREWQEKTTGQTKLRWGAEIG